MRTSLGQYDVSGPSFAFTKLAEDTVKFAISQYVFRSLFPNPDQEQESLSSEPDSKPVRPSVEVSEAELESLIHQSTDADRHALLFQHGLTIRRSIEVELSAQTGLKLVDLHRDMVRSLFRLHEAIDACPASFEVRMLYLSEIGVTGSLWSTLLSSRWGEHDALELLDELNHQDSQFIGIVPTIIQASTLSIAFGATKNLEYRQRGRDVYRTLLRSVGGALPINTIFENYGSFASQIFEFMKMAFIPFVVQFMALLMQRLVEVPLTAVIGRQAAAFAINLKKPTDGVELLEQCLMVVWGQANLRALAPADAVREHVEAEGTEMDQVLYAFLGLCIYVDMSGSSGAVKEPESLAYQLIERWLQLLDGARKEPGRTDLFRPRSFRNLVGAATVTPVVMINLWGSQCDALIIRKDETCKVVRLEGVTEEFAINMQSTLFGAFKSRSRGEDVPDLERGAASSSSTDVERVLAALWRTVVKPIFDDMGLECIEDATLDPPRLTWCLTGPTTFFPLHAAGQYDSEEKGTKAFEFVASSYTPTLSALANANDSLSKDLTSEFKGILAVSQENAPGFNEIPQTVAEVEALESAMSEANLSTHFRSLDGAEATKAAVLSGMQSSTWVHMACHALQFPLNTSESAFILANAEKLTLADITEAAAADGELAFLSACQTAAGDFDLSEEGVHLAASMLMAGYRSVIATTWSVRDIDAPIIARKVYDRLLRDGNIDRTGAALALHHATRHLRGQLGEHEILRWAPFIHLGV